MRYQISWVLMSVATLLFVCAASPTRGQDNKGGFGGGPGGKGKGGFGGGPGGFPGNDKGGFGGGGPGGPGKGKGKGGPGGGPGGFAGKGKGGFGGGPGGFPGQGPGGFPPGGGAQGNDNDNEIAGSLMQNGGNQSIRIIEEQDLDARPVMARAGKLPKGLPPWFKQLDTNRDGQVALSEWHRGGRDIDEFREWDRNDDGFITAEEALYKQRLVQVASASSELEDDNSPTPPIMGAGNGPSMNPLADGFRGKAKGDKGKQRPQ